MKIFQVVIVESEHVIILTLCILIFAIHYIKMIKMSGWLPVLDTLFFGGGGGRKKGGDFPAPN